ncbi:nuclear transport factor 2 family protein [Streptomyces hainanensis]|uniref:Nuclear transport factor 2 family protein n=1 Tax=Streptomyces hainanensis TaxID=402648 RepID=A0A4R4SS80_9ACTN|nr:nuclear transport factor 2 family protein [Streptomyces hainanensis]TDC66821.1 nuclear transport factor 2 family protein [Streptomyces hainanensis]
MTPGPLIPPGSTDRLDLATLVDRMAVTDVVAAFGPSYDSGDFAALTGLFTEDARYEVLPAVPPLPSVVVGRDEVLRTLRQRWHHNRHTLGVHQRHVTTNIVVVRQSRVLAETRSLLTVTFAHEDGRHELVRTGGYADLLRKEDGRWRLARRQLHIAGLPPPSVPLSLDEEGPQT